jgi:glucan biosynthesis protein C
MFQQRFAALFRKCRNIIKEHFNMNKSNNRTLYIDYLRSFITVLVVAHHSSLAYTTFAKFDKIAYINSTHPIVDKVRWIGLDIFENFNDVFFMSLMFLISGLFLVKSINKKGTANFIKDRFLRLFIPFLFGGTLLMLLAYYPSYYIAHGINDIPAYIVDFFTIEKWPVGPPWFIWELFFFNLIFAFIYPTIRKIIDRLGSFLTVFKNRPVLLLVFWFLFTWALYVPLAYSVGAGTWTGVGPFDFQLSRILLYFGYFMFGVILGNTDFNNEILSDESNLVKKWKLWIILSLAVYGLLIIISKPLQNLVEANKIKALYAWMIYYANYVASCTFTCIAFISTFRKHSGFQKSWWNSLADNAYLIYLIHYVFVTWSQFILLNFDMHAFSKFIITFVVSISASWIVSIVIRKNQTIRSYV